MTDITSAIKMEEEAFQRMKKQSLKKAGTAKPSVKSKHITGIFIKQFIGVLIR